MVGATNARCRWTPVRSHGHITTNLRGSACHTKPATTGVICQGSPAASGAEPPPEQVCWLARGASYEVREMTLRPPSSPLQRPSGGPLPLMDGERVTAIGARWRRQCPRGLRRPASRRRPFLSAEGANLWCMPEIGLVTTAQLARTLKRDYKNVRATWQPCRLDGMACRTS
jgi:hypothetical protein